MCPCTALHDGPLMEEVEEVGEQINDTASSMAAGLVDFSSEGKVWLTRLKHLLLQNDLCACMAAIRQEVHYQC